MIPSTMDAVLDSPESTYRVKDVVKRLDGKCSLLSRNGIDIVDIVEMGRRRGCSRSISDLIEWQRDYVSSDFLPSPPPESSRL